MNGVCRFRPTDEAKKKFKDKLRQVTKRNRSGTFQDIVKEIKLFGQGWINYFGLGHIKSFIKETQGWLHHRIRQLILKRWKKT